MSATLTVLLVSVASSLFAREAVGHVGVDEPAGGEVFLSGSALTIQWHIQVEHDLESWNVTYSVSGINGPWIEIATGLPPGSPLLDSIHTYDWIVPQVETNQARIRVEMVNSTFTNYLGFTATDFTIEILAVPATSQWGLAVLGILLAAVGTLVLRRRRVFA